MISIVLKSAAVARTASAKKVTASHMKQVVEAETQFDFLEEIIKKVPDQPVATKNHDDSEGAAEGGKKRRAAAGGGRRRKNQDEDDND